MPEQDTLQATINAVHAAGLDDELWPGALARMTRLLGGVAATFEVFDVSSGRPREFRAFNLPRPQEIEYLDHYVALNPRVPHGLRQRAGDIGWDHQILDKRAIARDPFYAEFLPRLDFRYFVSAVVMRDRHQFVAAAVQRSPKQGHVHRREIALMRRLVPHLRQAYDVTRRLRSADGAARTFEHALDWLADGTALVRADGSVLYANEPLRAIARKGDGIIVAGNQIEFVSAEARARYAAALATAARTRRGEVGDAAAVDFPVSRASGAPPYLVSVRPLVPAQNERRTQPLGDAIVFVRNPLRRHASSIAILRELFGFTQAEASLARALQSGASLADYARAQSLSLNTVYTHLRRVKEKTRSKRQTELIRKLNDLQMPLRDD